MRLLLPFLLCAAALLGCAASDGEPTPAGEPTSGGVTYAEDGAPEGLPRYRRWSERVAQGAQPHGDEAFRNLAALGFTTVLSVDGARTDVAAAERHGLRYVHVPIGYEGVGDDDALRIVKAVETAPGPVYVHCHHGRHRGSAAALIARIALEDVGSEQAVADLRTAGCSPKYAGLYRDVAAFRPPSAAELAAVPADLPALVEPEDLVGLMIEVDTRFLHLADVRDAGWGVPPDSPDIDPAHEALMLREGLREGARLDEARALGARFVALMRESEAAAAALEAVLRDDGARDAAAKQAAYDALGETCETCHAAYRN